MSKLSALSDGELLEEVRAGDNEAYAMLFSRHRDVALRVANRATPDPHLAEDAVEDAFISVLTAIKRGSGPVGVFSPYLLSTVQRAAYRMNRSSMREATILDPEVHDAPVEAEPVETSSFDAEAARNAFAGLPDRWREVVWYLDIEDMKPQQAAPLLGLSPNATVALHRRAKDGLRLGYLQQHLSNNGPADCRDISADIPAYVMGSLAKRRSAKVEEHLETCTYCTAVLAQISEVSTFRGAILAALAVMPLSQIYPEALRGGVTPELDAPGGGNAWRLWSASVMAVLCLSSTAAGIGMMLQPGQGADAAPPSLKSPIQPTGDTEKDLADFTVIRHSGEKVVSRISVEMGSGSALSTGDSMVFEAGQNSQIFDFSIERAGGWSCSTSGATLQCAVTSEASTSDLVLLVELSRPSCVNSSLNTLAMASQGKRTVLGQWPVPCLPAD